MGRIMPLIQTKSLQTKLSWECAGGRIRKLSHGGCPLRSLPRDWYLLFTQTFLTLKYISCLAHCQKLLLRTIFKETCYVRTSSPSSQVIISLELASQADHSEIE